MATTSALITTIISYTDNVSATDSDNATRRARVLQYIQEIFDEVWLYREWPWRITSGTITVTSGNSSVVVPADFNELGQHGGVYNSDGIRMLEITPQQLLEYRERGLTGSPNTEFAIFDYDSSTGRSKFQVPTAVGSNTNFKIWYNRTAPTLVDATDSTNNLYFIPAQYHHTVLLPGAVAKLRKAKGDTRDWDEKFYRGLAVMTLRERPRKTAVQQMPLSLVGGW